MKSYRNAVATLLLTLVLTTSVSAADGIMYTGIAPPPPPPAQADGIMYTGIATPAPEGDVLTEIALSLLQTLITLL